MDQTCPVVHKSRRPQARLKTVTLFYIHCGWAPAEADGFWGPTFLPSIACEIRFMGQLGQGYVVD
jgi:hypothetical protein